MGQILSPQLPVTGTLDKSVQKTTLGYVRSEAHTLLGVIFFPLGIPARVSRSLRLGPSCRNVTESTGLRRKDLGYTLVLPLICFTIMDLLPPFLI